MSALMGHPSTMGDSYQLNTTNIIRQAVATYPEQEIVYRTADGGWDRYTYAECFARVTRSANALADLGVRAGDVVGVLDFNSRRFFELYWSIPGLGAVMLQMNLRLAIEDLAYVTNHSKATVVLVDESLVPIAEQLRTMCPQVHTWVVMSDTPVPGASSLDYEALLAAASDTREWAVIDERSAYSACYTTGTTGRPKGVYYSHRAIVLHSYAVAMEDRAGAHDCVMLTTPLFHVSCWGMGQMAMLVRCKIVLPGRFAVDDLGPLVEIMVGEKVTVTNGAPAIFAPMLRYIESMPTKPDFAGARFISGSTEPPLSLMQGFAELTGANIIHGYGATETSPLATSNWKLKPALEDRLTDEQKWDLKRCQGLPVSGIDVEILGEHDELLPHDGTSIGEVIMRGPWITTAYDDLQEAPDAAPRFWNGWWRSGDVGVIDEWGYLKLTDRAKDIIKSGGEWISSIDMENALSAMPGVLEAAVIGVPHPRWDERPVAVVVPEPGVDLTLSDVTAHLAGKFAGWQLPDELRVVEQLPRTSVGKLNKKLLRTQYQDVYDARHAD